MPECERAPSLVDLSNVSFLDSTARRAFLASRNRLRRADPNGGSRADLRAVAGRAEIKRLRMRQETVGLRGLTERRDRTTRG